MNEAVISHRLTHFTASPGLRRGRQKSCYKQLYFHLASFLTHSHKNLLHTMSYQEEVNFPRHLVVQYLLCFLLSLLMPWCLSTSYQFNLDHGGSNNSELKYADLSHLQSVTEADTGTCNLIYCFPPSLLMKSGSKLLHASPCSSQLKVNYLQEKMPYFSSSDIDLFRDLDKQRLNTFIFPVCTITMCLVRLHSTHSCFITELLIITAMVYETQTHSFCVCMKCLIRSGDTWQERSLKHNHMYMKTSLLASRC